MFGLFGSSKPSDKEYRVRVDVPWTMTEKTARKIFKGLDAMSDPEINRCIEVLTQRSLVLTLTKKEYEYLHRKMFIIEDARKLIDDKELADDEAEECDCSTLCPGCGSYDFNKALSWFEEKSHNVFSLNGGG